MYNNFFHNFKKKKMDTTKMYFSNCYLMDRQTIAHLYHWILFNNQKKWAIKPQKTGLMEEASLKRSYAVYFQLYDI